MEDVGQRVLVTGAGGFIGHHVTSYLKSLGHWVRGVEARLARTYRSIEARLNQRRQLPATGEERRRVAATS